MPTGIYEGNKGRVPWNKGKKFSPLSKEHKDKIREGTKKHLPSTAFKKGFAPHNKGKKGWINQGSFKVGHSSFQEKGEKSHAWKDGRRLHGNYYIIYKPNHPFAHYKGYVLEHRLVMEEHLGRYLKPNEVIHHIDGDTTNNSINNLMLFPNGAAHISYHKHLRLVS